MEKKGDWKNLDGRTINTDAVDGEFIRAPKTAALERLPRPKTIGKPRPSKLKTKSP